MKCRYCDKCFKTKREIMAHVKTTHENKIQICKNNIEKTCRFRSNCWFRHIKNPLLNTNPNPISNNVSQNSSDMENDSISESNN